MRGFTLLEILLSVAIVALLAGLGAPIYQSLQVRNDLDIAANSIVGSLRRAHMLSVSVDGDTTWGLSVKSSAITLFQGPSYVARNAHFDEVFDLPGTVTSSGVTEIVFDTFTGEPQATGTITLISNTNESRNITINEKGTITY